MALLCQITPIIVVFLLSLSFEYGYSNSDGRTHRSGSAGPTVTCMVGNGSKDCKAFETCCQSVCGFDNGYIVTCSAVGGGGGGVNNARCVCAGQEGSSAQPIPVPTPIIGGDPHPTVVAHQVLECGRPKVASRGRIVGGKEAIPHAWPWQISLRITNHAPGTDGMHICGGSIVDWYHVITAAHCLQKSNDSSHYRVLAGLHNYRKPEPYYQGVNVANLTIHPDYQKRHDYSNDLAVLRLAEPIEFNRNVSPICLPVEAVEPNEPCVVTGWGNTKGTANNRYLQQVVVPTIASELCNGSAQYDGQIDQSMLCAAADGKDSCDGDSGGPLVCANEQRRWELQGVVSWGEDCAVADKPGVYTRIALFKQWIEKILAS